MGESSDFTVLGQEQFQGTTTKPSLVAVQGSLVRISDIPSNLFHRLNLRSGTNTRDRKADVDSGADTLVKQFGLQEYLAVGDGNDIGGNVGRHVTALSLDDRKGGERSGTMGFVHLSRTFEETRMQVENTFMVSIHALTVEK